MAILFQETVDASVLGGTSIILPVISGGIDQAYIMMVPIDGNTVSVVGISGGGMSWALLKRQCGGRGKAAIEMWRAVGSPSAFIATVTLTTNGDAIACLKRYTGVDQVTPTEDAVGHNTNGENGACAGGMDDAAPEVTTGSTVTDSAHVVGLNSRGATVSSFDPNYTNRASLVSGIGGSQIRLEAFDFIKTPIGDDQFTAVLSATADWSTVGVVLRRRIVTTAVDINLAGAYVINFATNDITKGAAYNIKLADVDIIRAGEYRMRSVLDISPLGQYAIIIEDNDLGLAGLYRILREINIPMPQTGIYRIILAGVDISLAGVYRIKNLIDITKGGQYTVISEQQVQMAGSYSVGDTKDLNKVGVYRVLLVDQDIVKAGAYRLILTDQDINFAGNYFIVTSPEVQLVGEYRMINIKDIQVGGAYKVQPTFDIDLLGLYRVLAAVNDLGFNGEYRMQQLTDIGLGGTYRISTQPVVELNLFCPLTEDAPGPEVTLDLPLSEV